MESFDYFAPTHGPWRRVWAWMSQEDRERRYCEALRRRTLLEEIAARPPGTSERSAVRKHANGLHRSRILRWKRRYGLHGLEGLIDWRMPPVSSMPEEVRADICALRRVSPDIGVQQIVDHIKQHHNFTTSGRTVSRVLKKAGLHRRRGSAPGVSSRECYIELGGMKLVEAAYEETGYVSALCNGVLAQLQPLLDLSAQPLDTSDRDEYGRFESNYNERYRLGSSDALGPGYASVEQKRESKDLTQLHVLSSSQEVVERKLKALLVSPLLGSGRWDGIRVPRGELLEELCGFAYMPSTLDLFTRELKYVGVSSTLWEIHAQLALAQTRHWGDPRSLAVLYVDGTTKPVWTQLFSEATKVSQVGRVMPGLELVSFHTGYGVPLWMVSTSGRAPLVKHIPELLPALEHTLDDEQIGRIVVVDAEANSIPFLKTLESEPLERAWVTRLRKGWVQGKEIFNRCNYRAYRNGDRVRMGLADFPDPEVKGGSFRMRVIEIERRTKGAVTYLGASMRLDDREWKPQDIADLYFERWPAQEADFRASSQAVNFKQVHGYGKQLVDNISVVTELDKLAQRSQTLEQRVEEGLSELEQNEAQLKEAERQLSKQQHRQETVARQFDTKLVEGKKITAKMQNMAAERRELDHEIRKQTKKVERAQKAVEEGATQTERNIDRVNKIKGIRQAKESQRTIFRHDVELDSLFSLLKVGLTFLVTYVLREYLGDASMEVVTFLDRVATLPARLRVTPQLEILTFEYNRRDPDVMALLVVNAEAINARKLTMSSGRTLRVQVDEAPPPRRPPPAGKRSNTGGRFVKD